MLYTCNLYDIVPQLCFNKIKQGCFFLKKQCVLVEKHRIKKNDSHIHY